MAKSWRYAGNGTRVGLMICTACHKAIGDTDGDFRYRETSDAYLPQHRACSPGDPEWARIDQRRQEYSAYWARREAAMQAFVNEFGAPDDSLIDECMANRPSPGGCACTSIDRSHCNEPGCNFLSRGVR